MNKLPITKSQKTMLLAGLLSLVFTEVLGRILPSLLPYSSNRAVMYAVLRIIGNIVMSLTLGISAYLWVRASREKRIATKPIVLFVVIVTLAITMISLGYIRSRSINGLNQYFESTNAEKDKRTVNSLSKDLPMRNKSGLSYLHAQAIYREEGRLIEYLTPEGNTAVYVPLEEDQNARDNILFWRSYSALTKVEFVIQIVSTIAVLIVSIATWPLIGNNAAKPPGSR